MNKQLTRFYLIFYSIALLLVFHSVAYSLSDREVIGKWIDDTPNIGSTIEIYKQNGKFYLFSRFNDGSTLTQELTKARSSVGKATFHEINSTQGDHCVITKDNSLELRDKQGWIFTARPINTMKQTARPINTIKQTESFLVNMFFITTLAGVIAIIALILLKLLGMSKEKNPQKASKQFDKLLIICLVGGGLFGFAVTKEFFVVLGGACLGGGIFYLLYKILAPQSYKEQVDASTIADQEQRAKWDQEKEQMRIQEMSRLGVKCPTCSSNNVERISTAKKATYVAATGILAPAFKKVRSQFECKKCGYKW